MKTLKVADMCQTSPFEVDFLVKEILSLGCTLEWNHIEEKDFEISADTIKQFDVSLLNGQGCIEVGDLVHHSNLNLHYIKYFDVIENIKGKLWGDSLFSKSFNQVFLDLRKNRQLAGSVIFLGGAPYYSPIVYTLAKFGYRDFNFLCTQEEFATVAKISKNLIDVRLHLLDSAELIQSSKEYSLCLVTSLRYPESVLSDISYFHFLSQRSLVLNLVGDTNFPFQEVSALSTEVVGPNSMSDARLAHLRDKILDCAKKLSG